MPGATFDETLAAHPELEDPAYLDRFYSRDLLMSEAARSDRVPPDRSPLPEQSPG